MNIQELKNYLNCDDVFLVGLIQKFIEEVNEIVTTIKMAANGGDWPTVKSNAHKMLSSVRIFDMVEIIDVLEKLEIEAEGKKDADSINKYVIKLLTLSENAINDMNRGLKEIELNN